MRLVNGEEGEAAPGEKLEAAWRHQSLGRDVDEVERAVANCAFDLRGFAVSTGAACSSGALTPSHVLTAIGLTDDRARASMRFSLGRGNTVEQVDSLVEAIGASVAHLRRISVHA